MIVHTTTFCIEAWINSFLKSYISIITYLNLKTCHGNSPTLILYWWNGTTCAQADDRYAYLCSELRKIQFSNVQVLRFACVLWFLHLIVLYTSPKLSWCIYLSHNLQKILIWTELILHCYSKMWTKKLQCIIVQTELPQFECINIYITVIAVHPPKKGYNLLVLNLARRVYCDWV